MDWNPRTDMLTGNNAAIRIQIGIEGAPHGASSSSLPRGIARTSGVDTTPNTGATNSGTERALTFPPSYSQRMN